MPLRDLAMLDDATFDATDVRVTDGCVVLHGSVVERGTSVGTARLPVTLSAQDAVGVTVDLAGGTGDHGPFSRVTERFTWKEKLKW